MSGCRQRGGAKLNEKKKSKVSSKPNKKTSDVAESLWRWSRWITTWMRFWQIWCFFFVLLFETPSRRCSETSQSSLLVNLIYSEVRRCSVSAALRLLKEHNHCWFTRVFAVRLSLKKKKKTFVAFLFFFSSFSVLPHAHENIQQDVFSTKKI